MLSVHNVSVPPKHLHVCYALSIDGHSVYADLVTISALCVKRIYPASKITILTDDSSVRNFGSALQRLLDVATEMRSVGKFFGSPRLRSRFVKTQARSQLEGDFLYLDADTVSVITCPVDYTENLRLTDALGELSGPF